MVGRTEQYRGAAAMIGGIDSIREQGFYKVRLAYGNKPTVAYWIASKRAWQVVGSSKTLKSDKIVHVGERVSF